MKNTPGVWGQSPHAGVRGEGPRNTNGKGFVCINIVYKIGVRLPRKEGPQFYRRYLYARQANHMGASETMKTESARGGGPQGGTRGDAEGGHPAGRGGPPRNPARAALMYEGRRPTEVPTQQSNKTHGSAERHDQSNDVRCAGTRDTTEPRSSQHRASHGRAC